MGKYKMGDDVWVVSDIDELVIKCKIVGIGYDKYYWVDEPFGHAVHENLLFETKELAAKSVSFKPRMTYEYWRRQKIKFIAQTHVGEYVFPYPSEKAKDIDWFYCEDI